MFLSWKTILEILETISGNLSRSSICDVKRQAGTQHMLPPATLPQSLASINIARPKIKNEGPNMLKYFATPLWAIRTTRGVQDVLNGSQKCTRGPLTSCMLDASGDALWGHTIMPQHVKCLPPLHLLSGGHGAWVPVGMKVFLALCFLQVMLVPCSCHVFGREALRTGKPENVRTCQQYAQTP